MPISKENHLALLRDILANHHQDCCGSTSEYEQASRIINNLLAEHQLDAHSVSVLQEIETYCRNGATLATHETHINEHQESLTEWVSHLDEITHPM